MEIEIVSKKNNPLLNRTEIYFKIRHNGEKTPTRDIIKTELAEKINAKKEDVIVNYLHTTFGLQELHGYAKVYFSPDKLKGLEREHILIRNKLLQPKKTEKKPETKTGKPVEAAKQEPKTEPVKKPPEPQPDQKKV
ncbi:MAG: 30S ribosomal protein S24e [Candidatus Thermoplasmatota archaeon]|jgi:small subunit ribosomal protein S24e|nr:30S ribosomal protein S24e [Candidatus Thermoplasmatota archaeon]